MGKAKPNPAWELTLAEAAGPGGGWTGAGRCGLLTSDFLPSNPFAHPAAS